MTTEEFSNEFDILYNNVMSNQAPGLDEYEKSVFLTKAQSDLIRDYFNRRVDGAEGGFDGSQKRQYDFSSLIKTERLSIVLDEEDNITIDNRSKSYYFPEDYFLSINEIIQDTKTQYSVVPISYQDYQTLMTKPYAYPPKKIAWRLITNMSDKKKAIIEIIGRFEGNITYSLRYVKKPSPIILEDISSEKLTIEGKSIKTDCTLPEQVHSEILERAVTLAKIAYQGSSETLAQAQQNRNNQ